MITLYGSFFLTITLALYACYVIPAERKQRVKARLSLLMNEEHDEPGPASKEGRPKLAARFMQAIASRFRRQFRRRIDVKKQAKLDLLLAQAGRPLQMTAVDFRLLQMVVLLLFPALCWAYSAWLLRAGTGTVVLVSLMGVLAGWRLPYVYLAMKSKQRAKQILRELPDVLDLLTVSLEAGLGFDAALGKLVAKKEGVLSEEFHRCLEEIRLGRTRREALLGLRDRVVLDEIRSLVGSILQAEKLGIGMVQVLRVQSVEMREKRKQRAEEAAMKAPIKMLFPLVLFIFPCLFIVLLGPVLIQMMETFGGK